jgi:hypothetical protein
MTSSYDTLIIGCEANTVTISLGGIDTLEIEVL